MTAKDIEDRYNKELLTSIEELRTHIKYSENKDNKQLNSSILYDYFERKTYVLEIDQCSISQLKEYIKEFDKEAKLFRKNLYYSEGLEAEGCGYEDDTDLDYIQLSAKWWIPKSEDSQYFKTLAMRRTKTWISSVIRADRNVKENQYFSIDCKILELFKNETIDYETFCDITLSNCQI